MLWFFLALAAALTQAGNDVISKRFFGDLTAYEMGLIRLLFAMPLLLVGLVYVPWPELDRTFWLCMALGMPLEVIAFLCYMRAIKVSPLSLTLPFLAFTPALVILTGFIILDEELNMYGAMGIMLIVTGSYTLNLSYAKRDFFAPFLAIYKEQGSRLMLMTAFLYSLTSAIGKLAISHSSPQFFGVIYFLFLGLIIIALFPLMPGARIDNLFKRPLIGLIAGFVLATMIFCHTCAISLVQAAYMISVKRTSLLFGVIFGWLVFKEENIKERLLGVSIMMAGVVIIGFPG
jgi:drug/metabolite transporter (DMT)-like permease